MHTGWRFYIGDVRYNCMQQLIAPSATCDSNAKDRTKLQLQFPRKNWTPTNTSGLSKKSWDMKKVRPAYIGDRVATPQTPRPKLTCVHVVSVCYHMQTTSRQPKGPRVTVNITTLFKTGTLLLSGLSKKSWDMKKVRPAYIGDRVATPQTPRPKLTCVHVVSVCYHMQTTSRQPKGPRVTVNITTLFKTGTLLLSGLSKKSWDMKKVRPAYIGDRVATPQTPRPKLTCVHVVSVCYHMQTTSRQPKGPRVTVNITTLFKVHCDRNVIVEWTFQKKLGYEKSSTCIYRDRVATPQTPRPKLTCVHVVSVCYHMQTTSRQPKVTCDCKHNDTVQSTLWFDV
ncbi:Mast/stem cell growth factor receptor kita [Trichinella pseudospiralis]